MVCFAVVFLYRDFSIGFPEKSDAASTRRSLFFYFDYVTVFIEDASAKISIVD